MQIMLDPWLTEDQPPSIAPFLVGSLIIWKRNRVWWQGPMQKQNFTQWPKEFVNYYGWRLFLEDLKIKWDDSMRLYCDNKSAISMTHNLMQYDWMKHIKINIYFLKEKLDNGLICISCVSIDLQIANILTKGLSNTTFQASVSMLRMENIYSST